MGFMLTSIGVVVLFILANLFGTYWNNALSVQDQAVVRPV